MDEMIIWMFPHIMFVALSKRQTKKHAPLKWSCLKVTNEAIPPNFSGFTDIMQYILFSTFQPDATKWHKRTRLSLKVWTMCERLWSHPSLPRPGPQSSVCLQGAILTYTAQLSAGTDAMFLWKTYSTNSPCRAQRRWKTTKVEWEQQRHDDFRTTKAKKQTKGLVRPDQPQVAWTKAFDAQKTRNSPWPRICITGCKLRMLVLWLQDLLVHMANELGRWAIQWNFCLQPH